MRSQFYSWEWFYVIIVSYVYTIHMVYMSSVIFESSFWVILYLKKRKNDMLVAEKLSQPLLSCKKSET